MFIFVQSTTQLLRSPTKLLWYNTNILYLSYLLVLLDIEQDIDGKAVQVEILDTAGQDEYTPLRETFMHTGNGFLLVYSVIDDQTLEELKSIREQILRVYKGKKVYHIFFYCREDSLSSIYQ